MPAQLGERGRHVVVEAEVLVTFPRGDHLGRARAGAVGLAAHAPDDLLGEAEPELLVVLQLRVALQLVEGGEPRVVVATRVEREAVPSTEPRIAVRPELRAGPESVKSTSKSTAVTIGPRISVLTRLIWSRSSLSSGPAAGAGFTPAQAHSRAPPAGQEGGARGGAMGFPRVDRGAQI